MRIGKLSFKQAYIRNQNEKSNTAVNVIAVIFLFLTFLFPYYSSYKKGKVGVNNSKNNKYNLVSTALRHANKPILYTLIILSIIFGTLLLDDKGFFKSSDERIIVPIAIYGMALNTFLLTIIIPEWFIPHNILGVTILILASLLILFIDNSYSDYFIKDDLTSINTITILFKILFGVALFLTLYNLYNNYIRKVKLFPQYVPTVRNLLGFTQISLFLLSASAVAVMSTYPSLPDTKPELTGF